MKRFGVRAIGLGLALTAGSALAADGDWRSVGAADPPLGVVPAGTPGLLPTPMRKAPTKDEGPIWLPARQPAAPVQQVGARTEPAPVAPPSVPQTQPLPLPQSGAIGPRVSSVSDGGPAPALPPIPDVPEQPPMRPVTQPPVPQPDEPQANPLPAPRASDPPPMRQPQSPFNQPSWNGVNPQANPLPTPRPVDQRPIWQEEQPAPFPVLQPAPAELMYPAGAFEVSKHNTFGSPPIRISRDYPSLSELTGRNSRDLSVVDDGANGANGPMNRYFVRGEYLLWWMPGFATPVLGTTNANTNLNGYLGEPGTTSLLGPGAFLGSTRSGFRIRAGAWLDESQSCGIDGGFFFLGNKSASVTFSPDQFPLITRPIFAPNLIPGTDQPFGENGEAVAVPGILRGSLGVQADSRLWGADMNARWCWKNTCDSRSEIFAGYRHLNLRESLAITENITVIGSGGDRLVIPDPIGTQIVVQDRFVTRNQFHGAQVGGAYDRRWGRWDLEARGSVALGATHQILEISGFQTRQQPGGPQVAFNNGGLLAGGSNIGKFSRDRFSVAPELTLNLGYAVTPNIRVFAGYNFLYWSNVIRPGDQIDHVVDLTLVPNAPAVGFSGQFRPRPLFKQSDLAINGVQFGLELKW
ncbi:hypothetical protein VT84_02250 [Gemmata sp. SH-PL17]|uniref:BBP7 family outer membrane beta-barrel protein n=1 Tax=Gemmata sp. SH-PL17 TaxID=1630693 RepID=UPI00078BB351|nr:BBP7 family outer membrane beta-barrel protein [Gemmata sp. SH-PL17]AMV23201.1 hypothetical protein VT84_02250 [Gemmata sp. SH-PL17]